MIKINIAGGYLIGLLLTLTFNFIGQLFFFVNTELAIAKICDISEPRTSGRYRGSHDLFYACFEQKAIFEIKAGVDEFSALWLMHSWPYVILSGFIMAAVRAARYGTKYLFIYRILYSIKLKN